MSESPSRSISRRGRTLKLYLVDGSPSGVITAELGISSVRAAVASRTALPELIRREEAARTGLYLLVGPDPDLPGRQLVYVGEGDQVKSRLAAHDSDESKEFFTRAVLIVARDASVAAGFGVAVVALVASVAFDPLFLLFHRIVFPQGNFLFAPDSNLLAVYPDVYWYEVTIRVGLTFVAAMAVIAVAAGATLRRIRR